MGSVCIRASEDFRQEEVDEDEFAVSPTRHQRDRDILLFGGCQKQLCTVSSSAEPAAGQPESRQLQPPHLWPRKAPMRCGKLDRRKAAQVDLHIYDIGTSGSGRCLNRFLRPLGTGVFHCGIEVYNCEWSFSDTTSRKERTGIFRCLPRDCEGHDYCESVMLGWTTFSEDDVLGIISLLQKEWPVDGYDLLRRNCCHFADAFCSRLRVRGLPDWVTNLAKTGATIEDAGEHFQRKAFEACAMCCTSSRPDEAPQVYFTTMETATVASKSGRHHARRVHAASF